MKICVICPVRSGTPNEVIEYVSRLEANGAKVHFPPRDNPQNDPTPDKSYVKVFLYAADKGLS